MLPLTLKTKQVNILIYLDAQLNTSDYTYFILYNKIDANMDEDDVYENNNNPQCCS